MAALTDSRWVTDDALAGLAVGTPLTLTQDVSGFTVDVNDPWFTLIGDYGFRSAFVRADAPTRRLLVVDATASDYPVVIGVWEVDPATGYQFVDPSWMPIAAGMGQVALTLMGGKSYVIEFAQQTDDAAHTALSVTVTWNRSSLTSSGLLRLGAGGPSGWTLRTPFDLGGPGTYLMVTPFDVLYLPLPTSKLITPFDLSGPVRSTLSTPFDFGTIAGWYLVTPFDLIALAPVPIVGVIPTPLPLPPGAVPLPNAGFIPGFAIYDKAGIYQGSVTLWETAAARSVALGQAGNLQFTVPIRRGTGESNDAELDLIQLDRIVVAGNNLGTEPWGGTISARDWQGGRLAVTVDDVFAFATGIEVGDSSASVDETQTPNPADPYAVAAYAKRIILRTGDPAAAAAAQVLAQVNQFRAAAGEVLWELDATGTNTFFGDENVSGDAISALGLLAERSFSEFAWRVRVDQGKMTPILVWRDHFTAPAGVDFTDGPGGNVGEGVIYRETSQTIINAMRLTGSVTSIQSKIPDGAQPLPVQERLPVADVWLDPGPYRRRTNLGQSAGIKVYVTVPFSFPADTQKGLADAAAAAMMKLFEQYLAAVHDQLGQPYHGGGFNNVGGWSWAGPAESIPEGYATFGERYLVLGDWKHRRYLATGPRSVVMVGISGTAAGSHVRVSFDLLTGQQTVARAGDAPTEDPTVVYPFERNYIKSWDPRRDGVGVKKVVDVIEGEVEYTGATRWRIVSWGQSDQNWSTTLGDPARGLSATDTTTVLASTLGAPPVPFMADIGGYETVKVTGIAGAAITMVRGQEGTTAVIHEPGETFTYTAPATGGTDTPPLPDAPPPLRVPWPEGEAFARRLLAKLSRPHRMISMPVVNRAGDWSTIAMGSTHAIAVHSEGPTSGLVIGTGRVIAMAPDEVTGKMEVVCEVDLP